MPTAWIIARHADDGLIVLADACQGRCTYADQASAEHALGKRFANNHASTLQSVYGKLWRSLHVREVECWHAGGDPKGSVCGAWKPFAGVKPVDHPIDTAAVLKHAAREYVRLRDGGEDSTAYRTYIEALADALRLGYARPEPHNEIERRILEDALIIPEE